jgi:hypothetical protein
MKTLTEHELAILDWTLQELRRDPIRAADLFYGRLFQRDRSLRPLLAGSFDLAGSRLLRTLKSGIEGLKDPADLVGLLTLCARPALRERLLDGTTLRTAGDALMWMLQHHLGDRYSDEIRAVWRGAYLAFCRTVENGLSLAPAASAAVSLDLGEPSP